MGQHCPRTLSMILRWKNRSCWISYKNFDGGIRFNFSTPGPTITSLAYTLLHIILHYYPLLYLLLHYPYFLLLLYYFYYLLYYLLYYQSSPYINTLKIQHSYLHLFLFFYFNFNIYFYYLFIYCYYSFYF